MNKPYRKEYDKDGNLLNPIEGAYKTLTLNRKQRRKLYKKINIKRK